MRGWAIDRYGEPMKLRELPVPQPRGNDVLMRVHGAEIGDWDELVRSGGWPLDRPFPLVLGLAGAGSVAAVGSGVRWFRENDAVYAYSYPLYDNGAWAEYMLVPVTQLARAPSRLAAAHAGAMPIVALTAHETIVDVLKVQRGESLLITAAAGGVGHLAVQIAAQLRAHVVATASPRSFDFVSGLGAEIVLDYTAGDIAAQVRERFPDGVDKALNGAASEEAANQAARAVRRGGHLVDLPGSVSQPPPGVRVDSDYVVRGDGARLSRITGMIDGGKLHVAVDGEFPFERAPQALQEVLKRRHRGAHALRVAGLRRTLSKPVQQPAWR